MNEKETESRFPLLFLRLIHSCSHFLICFTGYVQGMSDLLSPILVLMEDEVEAFWCFVGFMERMVRNNNLTVQLKCREQTVYF